MKFLKTTEKFLLILTVFILFAGCDAFNKEGGSFSVKFLWPENGKPDFSEGYYVWIEMQEWVDGDVENTKVHLKEGPVAFNSEGKASFNLKDLTYGKNRVVLVEVRRSESSLDRTLYYGVSKLFSLDSGKNTNVSVEMNMTATPGTENGKSNFSIAVFKDGLKVDKVSEKDVSVRILKAVGQKVIFSNRLELLDVQVNDLERDYTGAEVVDFSTLSEQSDGSFQYDGWDILEGREQNAQSDGMKVIYAKIIDENGYRSEMAYTSVSLDTKAPTVINSAVSPSGTPGMANIETDIVVRFMFSEPVEEFVFDSKGLEFTDNSSGENKIFTYKVTDADEDGATYDFKVSAKDEAGNELKDYTLGSVKIDSTVPQIKSFSVSKNKVRMGEEFSVEIEVSEELKSIVVLVGAKSISKNCKLKGDSKVNYICTHTANVDGDEGDGVKQIAVQVVDLADNPNSQTLKEDLVPVTIEYDITAPILASGVILPPVVNRSSETVAAKFSFVENVSFSLDDIVITPVTDLVFDCGDLSVAKSSYECSASFSNDDDRVADYTFSVSVEDEVGNTSDDVEIGTISVDRLAPSLTEQNIDPKSLKMNQSFTVTFKVSEELLAFPVVRVGEKIIPESSCSHNSTSGQYSCIHQANIDGDESDGIKAVSAYIVDKAGNAKTETFEDSISYDATAPVLISPVVIPSQHLNSYNDGFQVRFSFSEKVKFDDSFKFSVVTDSGDDMTNDFNCGSSAGDNQTFSCSKVFVEEDESQGEYTFYVYAYDLSGNRLPQDGTLNKIATVLIDRKSPGVSITKALPGKINYNSNYIDVTFTVDEPVGTKNPTVRIGTDIEVISPETVNGDRTEFTYRITSLSRLPDGSPEIYVQVEDGYGNTGEDSASLLEVDRTLPTVVDSNLNRLKAKKDDDVIVVITFSEEMKDGTVAVQDGGLGLIMDTEASSDQIYVYKYRVKETDEGAREKSYAITVTGDDLYDNQVSPAVNIGSVELDLTPPASTIVNFDLTTSTSSFYDVGGVPAASEHQPEVSFSFTVINADVLGSLPDASIGYEPPTTFSCVENGSDLDCSGTYTVSGGESEGTKMVGILLSDDTGNIAEHYPGSVVFDFTGPQLVSTLITRQPDYSPARDSYNKVQYFSPKDPFNDASVSLYLTMYADEQINTDSDVILDNLPCRTEPYIVGDTAVAGNSVSYNRYVDECIGTYTPVVTWSDMLGNESTMTSDWSASVAGDQPNSVDIDRDHMLFTRKPLGSIEEGETPFYSVYCNHCVRSGDIKYVLFYTETGLLAGSASVNGHNSFYITDLVGGDVPVIYVNPVSSTGNKIPVRTSGGEPLDIPTVLDPVPNVMWTMNLHQKTVAMPWPNPSAFYNDGVETGTFPALTSSKIEVEKRNAVDPGFFSNDPYPDYRFYHTGYAYAYNSFADEVAVYGGVSFIEPPGEYHYYTDIAFWDGARWVMPNIEGAKPDGRSDASMVFEEARNQYIFFGGSKYDSSWTYYDDTWIFDGEFWTKLTISGPSQRESAAMAYDPQREVTVLIGGYYNFNPVSDTSTWEFDGVSWKSVVLSDPEGDGNPSAGYGEMVYHPLLRKLVYHDTYNGETWAYDGESWEQLNDSGPICIDGAMVYDHNRKDVLFYGGKNVGTPLANSYRFNGQTWSASDAIDGLAGHIMWYSHTDKSTYVMTGETGSHIYSGKVVKAGPESTEEESGYILNNARTALCYNSGDNKIYYFGGQRYNFNTDTWSESKTFGTIDGKLDTSISFASGPSQMSNHDMVYYPPSDVVLVLDEGNLWQYNGSAWSVRSSTGPNDYDNYKMVYDGTGNEVVLVLIKPPKEGPGEVETWTYGSSGWQKETSTTQPNVNDTNGVALVYINTSAKVYSFSFSPSSPQTLSWNGSSWSTVSISDPESDGSPESSDYAVFVSMGDGEYPVLINRNSQNQQLEFWMFKGSSYARIDFDDVSSRYAFNAIYSPEDKGIYLLGGKTHNDEYAASVEDWYFIKIPRMVNPYQVYSVPLGYASMPENSVVQQIDLTWIGGGTTVSEGSDINGYRIDTMVHGGWEESFYSTGSYDEHSIVNISYKDPDTVDLMPVSVDDAVLFRSTPLLIDGTSDSKPEISTSNVEINIYYNIEGNRKMVPSITDKYYFLNTVMNWNNARNECLEMGYDLLMVDSQAELDVVLEHEDYVAGEYWIGKNDIYGEGDWRTVNGYALDDGFSNWKEEEPLSLSGYDCAYMNENGTWGSYTCSQSKKAICEIRTSDYVISTDSKTWTQASARCVELGLNLVKIDGSVEQNNLYNKLSGVTDAWIGYTDATTENEWRWMSGLLGWKGSSTGTSYYYNNWGSGYPISSTTRDYTYMEMSDSGKWRNLSSGYYKRYICEKDTSEQVCFLNGGSCSIDSECCSTLCSDDYSECVGCLENGDSSCSGPSDCCNNICNTVTDTCVDCLNAGDRTCSSSGDCCGKDLSCTSGKCCKGFGLSCSSTTECCTSHACGYADECRKIYGVFCKINSDCSTNVCARSQCSCYPVEIACSDSNECCSGNCFKGKCVCAPTSGRCIVDDDCCSKTCARGVCK